MSEHKKTITSVAFHPRDKDILASSSADYKICIWHIVKHTLLASLITPVTIPGLMAWFPLEEDCLAYCDGKGPIYLWKYTINGKDKTSQTLKEITSLSSNISQLKWHPTSFDRFVLGHADGTISLYIQGNRVSCISV